MKAIFKRSWFITLLILVSTSVFSQIYAPEGLNMPGEWNTWINPPSNNLAFASSTQVTDGRINLIDTGTLRWQTIFSVAATGADVTGGTYNWLFTSGPSTDYFANKWSDVTVIMNTLQEYTYQGTTDNNITIIDNHWYTMVWEDMGYANSRAIFMETTNEPADILTVSFPTTVQPDEIVNVNITTNTTPSPEELFYLRYTTDAWSTSVAIDISITGTSGTASIPGQPAGTTVQYYVFSTTVSGITSDYDLYTIKLNNNSGTNYEYTVSGGSSPEIDWANLQYPESGTIVLGDTFDVYAQVFIDGITNPTGQATGVEAWIGYSTENTDPSTWTNWVIATYSGDVGNNDEYISNLGIAIPAEGTYYYASRFQYLSQAYVYGGYSASGGGFWDGSTNISGVLTINGTPPDPQIGWANLQYPGSGIIEPGEEYLVYAQAWIEDVTGQTTPAPGLQCWIGYNEEDTDPSTWTNWIQADYFGVSGSNDEFIADIGTQINTTGIYYYASSFQYLDQAIVYGGYSEDGGGFWDGTTYINGVLTVTNDIITYPVTFTATDATGLYSNIKFKGSMTNWEPVDMVQNGNNWSVTLDILPGSYEWGVFEDDGSPNGIWLIIGPNLVVNISDIGEITGETTYTITYVDIEENAVSAKIYPNPVINNLSVKINSQNENYRIRIYNQVGILIESFEASEPQSLIDMSDYNPGNYILFISSDNQRTVKKVVKL